MTDPLDFLWRRRSVRQFTPGYRVPEAIVEQLLAAAMSAPSACARDPWRFRVIQDPVLLERITAALPNEKNAYEFASRENLDAFYWSNDLITCTVVGNLPEDEMKAVAKKIYTQLTWRPDNAART